MSKDVILETSTLRASLEAGSFVLPDLDERNDSVVSHLAWAQSVTTDVRERDDFLMEAEFPLDRAVCLYYVPQC